MPWLWLGIGAIALLILLIWGASGPSTKGMARTLSWLFLAFLAVVLLFLVACGDPFQGRRSRLPSPPRQSTVETDILRMHLDHDSGQLDGMILDGPDRGRYLSELNLDELKALLQECRLRDEESATLLEAYLARHRGGAWQQEERAETGSRGAASGRDGAMSRDEAFAILGLSPGAKPAEIRRAHHELMKKIHPDQGGSNYLATKINQAKETLLGS